ncbi:MAG: riboflavin synthase [Balneolales bacterium]|nr:riboflavin synthase [Balneolales bacterium]
MFTGIIEYTGRVSSLENYKGGLEINIQSDLANSLEIDDSVSINGACHTVVYKKENSFTVQSVEETLRKTSIGDLKKGDLVNLEDSLTLQKKLDGHIVQGHVDTTGKIQSIVEEGANWLIQISYPAEFARYMVPRGSISVDGISLTIARLTDKDFTLAIIPYTWTNTNLQQRKAGDRINLEFDVLGKYVLRALETGSLNNDHPYAAIKKEVVK